MTPDSSAPKGVICTFPDLDTARSITKTLLEERLIACANLLPQVESHYEWEGNMECSTEIMAWMKTSIERYSQLEQRLAELHPYEVPEILRIPIEAGLPAYLQWVHTQVQPA